MEALIGDQGVWGDPAAYRALPHYRNRPNRSLRFCRRIMIGRINRRIDRMGAEWGRRGARPTPEGGPAGSE